MGILLFLVTAATGSQGLEVQWLPMHDGHQAVWLVGLGAVGLLCVLLAAMGKVRFLLFLFAIHSAYMLIKGLLMSSYTFAGADDGRNAIILAAAAFIASIGSFPAPSSMTRKSR
jgi:hypothetical protein